MDRKEWERQVTAFLRRRLHDLAEIERGHIGAAVISKLALDYERGPISIKDLADGMVTIGESAKAQRWDKAAKEGWGAILQVARSLAENEPPKQDKPKEPLVISHPLLKVAKPDQKRVRPAPKRETKPQPVKTRTAPKPEPPKPQTVTKAAPKPETPKPQPIKTRPAPKPEPPNAPTLGERAARFFGGLFGRRK